MSHGYHIGGYASGLPMMLPVVDTVEVGSGGGSIARVDHTGSIRVGPVSAGADPGPACYGKGGTEPTVTDANLVLGRLDPNRFLGGEMPLDVQAACEAIKRRVASPLGLSEAEAARAVIQIAVMNMSLAVRQVSVERGYDPRDFVMVAFGGAGPLHACEVARSLHIPVVVIPNFPGQFSASGMLMAEPRHDFVRTYYRPLDQTDFIELSRIAAEMEALARERIGAKNIRMRHFLDMRYSGQDFSLPVPVDPNCYAAEYQAKLRDAFHEAHQTRFGYHDAALALEIVNSHLAATAPSSVHVLPAPPQGKGPALLGRRAVTFNADPVDCPVYQRLALAPGERIPGPAVIQEYASTTVLFPGDRAEVTRSGELLIRIGSAGDPK
jgi:N-methylhydantoinase A